MKLRSMIETVNHLKTWVPPEGIRFHLMLEPTRDLVVAILVHAECHDCKRDWRVDPTKPLDAAWTFLDLMASRVLADHCDCQAIEEVAPFRGLVELEELGDRINRWADDRAGVPRPSPSDTRG